MVAAAQIHILTGWKEISRYLDRGIRTVQRWEVELGLPIRRPAGGSRSSVLAIPSELDAWLASRPLGSFGSKAPRAIGKFEPEKHKALERFCELRESILQSVEELMATRSQLESTMAKLTTRLPLKLPPPQNGNNRRKFRAYRVHNP